ncbi:MAG: PKD domain-containing protein, partial [Schleiferiaceae bacterium]|nr:PKD domain-containing protein [Schleiferiaceae bacterium]
MKKTILLVWLSICLNVQATLSPGDIAFVGFNSDNPDGFSFITLAVIPPNEKIYFTDQGLVSSTAWLSNTESHWLFTAPSTGIPCGTIIEIKEPTSGAALTINGITGATIVFQPTPSGNSNFSLASGDQIIAYQASAARSAPASTTFIAAIHADDGGGSCLDPITKWNISSCVNSTGESVIPPGLTNGVNCVSLFPANGTEEDNAKYYSNLVGTPQDVGAFINDPNKWFSHDSAPFDISPSGYPSTWIKILCGITCTASNVTSQFQLNPSYGQAIPHTVFFTDQSINPDTWHWDFGDGSISTLQNPIHNYTAYGDYVISLTVTDTITGCQDTKYDTVYVRQPCDISVLAPGTQTGCSGGLYSKEIAVTFSNPPPFGNLVVNGQSFPIKTSPQTITLSNMPIGAGQVQLSAHFSAFSSCNKVVNNAYVAPVGCPPPNDECINAIAISCGDTVYGSNLYSSSSSNPCSGPGLGNWYKIIGTGTPLTVANCGLTNFDTKIEVMTGTTCNTLSCVGSNDDFCTLQSSVTFSSISGQQYWVFVSGRLSSDQGNYGLYVTCLCSISNLSSGVQTPCSSNMYSQDVIVTYSDEPSIGMLNVNGQNFAITSSPQTVTLSNLVADGLPVNVTAHFTAIPSCNIAENTLFTAPSACPVVGGTLCPSPFVVNVIPQGMNTNTWGNAVSDPYSFYFGLTQWKKLKSSVTGGVGPFSYSWGTINSGQIKPLGNKIDQKYLFQPMSDCKVYLNVTDQSTNCTYGDTIDITWNDDYFCGTIGP